MLLPSKTMFPRMERFSCLILRESTLIVCESHHAICGPKAPAETREGFGQGKDRSPPIASSCLRTDGESEFLAGKMFQEPRYGEVSQLIAK